MNNIILMGNKIYNCRLQVGMRRNVGIQLKSCSRLVGFPRFAWSIILHSLRRIISCTKVEKVSIVVCIITQVISLSRNISFKHFKKRLNLVNTIRTDRCSQFCLFRYLELRKYLFHFYITWYTHTKT